MYADNDVAIFVYGVNQVLGLMHNVVFRPENLLQLLHRLLQITGVSSCLPAFGESQDLEDFVPCLVVRHFPRQTLIVVPSVTTLQVPRVPEGKINERTMEQVGEVLNGPVVEDDDHLLVFGDALGH